MMSESSVRLAVIIPAYCPSAGLVELVRTLSARPFAAIVVVDDGSGAPYREIFAQVAAFPKVHLLRHAVNLGKGAALKAAFNYALCQFPNLIGVVTADADGQHHPEDIQGVAAALEAHPGALVLGSRSFAGDVPLRSRIGNVATRGIVHMLLGKRISDTQTGLRGIPASLLPHLLRIEARGYEFELEMLIAAHGMGIPLIEEPIRTIYEAGNASSHFNPVIDSMKIYFVLLRFGAVSFLTAAIDNLVYILVYHRLGLVLPSQILGRLVSVSFNYTAVRRSVFVSHAQHTAALPKYLLLVLASGTASYGGIMFLSTRFGVSAVSAKLLVETALFFLNFAVQRLFIFQSESGEEERRAVAPVVFSLGATAALIGLGALEIYGFSTAHLWAQDIWFPVGFTRFLRYGGVFLALALPLLLLVPWTLATVLVVLLLALTAFALGPLPVLAAAFLLVSACALGRLLMDRGHSEPTSESGQDDLLAMLLGLALFILLMYGVARVPVNYPAAWAAVLALPVLADFRGVWRRLRRWAHAVTSMELRAPAERAAFALLAFVLGAHWLVVLKPEVGADALATHLALPIEMAAHHALTLQPARFIWSVMPMGADFAYSIANLLGGEFAARLLDFAMLLALVALLYQAVRRFTGRAIAFLLAALFATTPMVQLVTGSLFIENTQAVMVFGMLAALWRFDDTAQRRYLNLAMLLGGAAVAIKFGSVIFVLVGLAFAVTLMFRHPKALGRRPAASIAIAAFLLLVTALPPYAIAYAKTGNPLFPFLNPRIHSPLLDHSVLIQDFRFVQPLTWTTLYDLTFYTTNFWEGQKGSFGFQYLLFAPLALLGLLVVTGRPARSAAAVALAASIVVLASTPNARYVYPALPLLMVPCAAVLAWMLAHQRWMARAVIAAAIGCVALNLYFLPSASYYDKDFCLRSPFSALERQRYVHGSAPMREVIAWFNRAHPQAPVLLADDSTFAGLTGDVYENHWHQYNIMDRLAHADTVPDAVRLLESWHVRYLIAHQPVADEPLHPEALAKLLEGCTALEYQSGDVYLARLDPTCARQPALAAAFVAQPGVYDDFDPALRFTGEWVHDRNFQQPDLQTISYANAPGAEISLTFNGQALTYVFTMAPNRGVAEVFIDGASQGTIDLYAGAIQWQTRRRFCCFASGKHVVSIRVTGQANARSAGRFVDVDSLVVE
ncbi:MAG TPA: glycosyltransferase [Bryobacteraceae bacterium]|nr:glycosyltransferase [Bryobacteraceae bacterium]